MKHSNCSAERTDEQAIAVARYQHWADLATTATRLLDPPANYSIVFADRDWNRDDADEYLSQCLVAHLEVEFPSVSWPREFDGWKRADTKYREIFRLVSRRRTFIGTCPICEGWQETEDPPQAQLKTLDTVEHFLQSRAGTIAKESLVSYRHTLMIFAKHCPQLPTKPEDLETYFARFKERRSAAAAYSPIKQLYEFAIQRFGFPNTMELIKRTRYKEKEPYSFILDEARAVVNACRNDRELGLIHLYLGHAFRLEEGCRTNIGDILDGQMVVRGKERQEFMPLLPETKEILLRLANGRSSEEPIFTGRKGRRLSHKMTYNVVKAILDRAGVTEGKEGQRIATHTLRKSFATLATHAGCNDRIVKRLLRHKTADITSLYVSMPMDVLRDNLERYSPIRLLNGQSKEELHKIFSCSILQPPFGYPIVGKAIGFT